VSSARQLSTEPRFDETEVRIVTPAISPEYALVAFRYDREPAAFALVNGALEVHGAPRVDDESSTSDRMPVDRDVGDGAKRAVIPKPEDINLSRSSEHVSGLDFLRRPTVNADHFDAEVTNSHAPPPGFGLSLV
jgi:hypothetical protein